MLSSRLAPLREGVTWARHVLGTALRGPVAQTRTAASEGLPSSLPLAQGRHRQGRSSDPWSVSVTVSVSGRDGAQGWSPGQRGASSGPHRRSPRGGPCGSGVGSARTGATGKGVWRRGGLPGETPGGASRLRKSSWFCALVGFFVGSRAWSLLLSSRAAVRRVSVSLTRNELEGQHPSDAAGSGRLSVPVLCFRDLSVVANALKAGCRARAPHLEARADSPRPPSRRERATRSQTGALLLSAPAAARQGDGVSGEARGARGAGLRPRLRGAALRAPRVLVLGGTGRSGGLCRLVPGSLEVASVRPL